MSALVVLLQSYQAISVIKQHSVTPIAIIFVCRCDVLEHHRKKTESSEILVAVNINIYIYCDTE